MECRICGEYGTVSRFSVRETRDEIFVCDECDTGWLHADLNNDFAFDLGEYLTSKGLPIDMGQLDLVEFDPPLEPGK